MMSEIRFQHQNMLLPMHDMQEKNVEVRDQNWETWDRRKTFEQVVELRGWNSSRS